MKNSGTVFWFTGLSGAGKTTIGRRFWERLREVRPSAVFLDGDDLREVFGNDLGHTQAERKRSAMRNSRLCRLLAAQGLDVVIATISLFHEIQDWNRGNIPDYREIFIKVPIKVLIKRDSKGIYSRKANGNDQNVVGLDIPVEEPKSPDLIIENAEGTNIEEVVQELVGQFRIGNLSARDSKHES